MTRNDKICASESHDLSRRNFLRLAVGSLVVLPAVEGGFIIPAEIAYAATSSGSEKDGGDSLEPVTKITMVSANEVGFVVVDTADGGYTTVPGAKIHIVSRYNKKTLDGTTNSEGKFIFDIKNLAENPDGESLDKLDSYAFNGTVSISANGYREFQTDLIRIEGGTGIMAPTRSIADKKPYPRKASFNEWDILYGKNAFMQTTKNSEKHTITMEFKQLGSGEATVSVKLTKDDSTVLSTKGTPSSGNLTVNFSDTLLLTGAATALPTTGTEDDFDNDEAYEAFKVEVVQGSNVYSWPLHLMVYEGTIQEPIEKDAQDLKPLKPLDTSPAQRNNTGLDCTWPKDLPIVGGGGITPFMPNCYLNLSLNPWGLLQFTAKTPAVGYRNDNGEEDKTRGWATYPRKSAFDQFNKQISTMQKMKDKAGSTYGGVKPYSNTSLLASIDLTVWAQIVIAAKWDTKKAFFEGILAGSIYVNFDFTVTWDFWAFSVPITITFSLKMTAVITLTGGAYTEEEKSGSAITAALGDSWHFDYSNTGLTVTFTVTPSLSAGVGVSGIASISLRGRYVLQMVFGYSFVKGTTPAGQSDFRRVYGYSADIAVVLNLFLFSATIPVKKWKYRDFYDSWKGGELSSQADDVEELMAQASDGEGMSGLIKKMNPITSAMLGRTCEVEGEDALSTQADDEADEPFDWEAMRKPDVDAALDTGQVITYAVYRIKPDEELTDEERAAEQAASGAMLTMTTASQGNSAASDDNDGLGLQAATIAEDKKPVLRRRQSNVVYKPFRHAALTWEQGLSTQADNSILMTPGVAALGSEGGIRPSSDKMIADHVFGDPRIKIVDLHTQTDDAELDLSATCSFRIGSVSVNGEMRTRVILTFINIGGNMFDNPEDYIGVSEVLDFPLGSDIKGFERDDLYDYDFDIAFTSSGDTDMVHMVVVSGKRANGDNTEFSQVATDLVFSYLNFRVADVFGWRPTQNIVKSMRAADDDGLCHCISNVKCATDGTVESNIILISYLEGIAKTPEELFSGDYGVSNAHVSFAIVNQEEGTWSVPKQDQIDAAIGSIESSGIFRMALSPKIGDSYTLTLSAIKETFFVVLKLDESKSAFSSIKQAAVLEDTLRLLPWPQQNCFLTSYPTASYIEELNANDGWKDPDKWDRTKWVLQKAVWDEEAGTPILKCEEIGPQNFNVENFGINNGGTFIFWPQTRAGGDGRRMYKPDGTYEEIEDDDLYQLMACRVHNGIFSEPFVAADLPHDLSSIEIVASRDNQAPLEVLSIEPIEGEDTDADGQPINHAVNVWYTAIPHVKCATAIGCLAPTPFVSPGGTLRFDIAIRNDGNSYLSGCTVQMYVHDYKDGTVSETATEVSGSTAVITFAKNTLVESHHNPIVNDEFQNVEADFALGPGKTSIYKTYIPIPKKWTTGDKYVSFVAKSPVLAEGGGLTTQTDGKGFWAQADGDPEYQEFSIGPGEYKPMHNNASSLEMRDDSHMAQIQVNGDNEAEAQGSHLADAPLTYRIISDSSSSDDSKGSGSDGSGSKGSGSGGSGSKGSGSGTGKSSAATKTGDPLPGSLALGLAAAGAAAAAVAAYERRRAANEAAAATEGIIETTPIDTEEDDEI